jgi:cell division protein FtsI/penicillin-binding protein 2
MHANVSPSPLTKDQELRSKDRIDLILFFWILFALVILGRAFYIQVLKHEYYTDLASKQYVSKIPINFDRGNISTLSLY